MSQKTVDELKSKGEKFELPNGEIVFFVPDEHLYLVRDRVVPSVTTLVNQIYENTYAGVDPELLKRTAAYGTAVHAELNDWIEIRKKDPNAQVISPYSEVQNYFTFIEPIYHIQPLFGEKIVVLYHPESNQPVAAGRFDLLCLINKTKTLVDFKTTSTIHRKEVTLQLNLYVLGLKQSYYVDFSEKINMGAIHLNGTISKYVPIIELSSSFLTNVCKKGFEHDTNTIIN